MQQKTNRYKIGSNPSIGDGHRDQPENHPPNKPVDQKMQKTLSQPVTSTFIRSTTHLTN